MKIDLLTCLLVDASVCLLYDTVRRTAHHTDDHCSLGRFTSSTRLMQVYSRPNHLYRLLGSSYK
jgi:hypothetical protein